MNDVKQYQSLDSLIQSEGGIHFSAYVTNCFPAPAVRSQIEEAIKVASEDIRLVLSREERQKFLKPIHALLLHEKTLSTINGNIGIFRSQNFFRVLNVPVPVEEYSTVASSFHIKPLLRWAQEDRMFRLITVNDKMCCLYSGSLYSLRPMETFALKAAGRRRLVTSYSSFWQIPAANKKQEKLRELLVWLEERVAADSGPNSPPLFVVGSKEVKDFLIHHLPYKNIHAVDAVTPRDLAKAVAKVRTLLRNEAESTIKDELVDFKLAAALDLTESNVFKIAEAARRGLVKKLIVAIDKKLFGKLSTKSGKLTLHSADVDHEDDDVLDDIAQAVIRRGGSVFVAPAQKIPGRHPLLAIINPQDPEGTTFEMMAERKQKKTTLSSVFEGVG